MTSRTLWPGTQRWSFPAFSLTTVPQGRPPAPRDRASEQRARCYSASIRDRRASTLTRLSSRNSKKILLSGLNGTILVSGKCCPSPTGWTLHHRIVAEDRSPSASRFLKIWRSPIRQASWRPCGGSVAAYPGRPAVSPQLLRRSGEGRLVRGSVHVGP